MVREEGLGDGGPTCVVYQALECSGAELPVPISQTLSIPSLSSIQRSLEPIVSPLHLKAQLPRLPLSQLLLRPHPIQPNQPTDNLAPALEISLRHAVHALNHFTQERV